ncbi:hypothetical protein POM88_052552 [Heracleum sosnowskyi]|uniref:Uncharacterized protein n=1 Tax=Heracleum sosnowskyi TaxID=360622 RepID=A0AAD8LYU7_9APIA|nr:hypothetical protein POM88_052552 [Heracleum sosnowskyi]
MSSPSHQFIVNNFPTQLNVTFFNVTPSPAKQSGNHAIVGIFGIAASVLLTALQLKYQSRTDSPFQDHPKAMAIAMTSLLIFCLGCDVEQYFSTTRHFLTTAVVVHHVLRLLGFISLASLASVIFSTSTNSAPSLIVYLNFPWFFSASNAQFNVAFINMTPLPAIERGNHGIVSIFGITVSVLLTALQLKYQARSDSPFQDHPKAMAIAISSLLIFCMGCDLEQIFVSPRRFSTSATMLHHVLRLLGFTSLASLAYIIFSTSSSSIPLLIVFLIFTWFFLTRFVLHWLQNNNLHGGRGANHLCTSHPHFAFNQNLDYIDSLPINHTAPANLV